jgi:predicted Zn-dependent protease
VLCGIAVVLAVVAGFVNRQYQAFLREEAILKAQAEAPTRARQEAVEQIAALERSLRANPRDRAARFRLAETYFKVRDYSRSLTELRTLERENPRDAEVFLRKAVVHRAVGDLIRAEREAKRALELKAASGSAELLLGEIYVEDYRYRDALGMFERRLKQDPNSIAALMGKARALEELLLIHNPIPVRDILAPAERAVELAPDNAELVISLARMKFAYLRGEEAASSAETLALRAIKLAPDHPQPYITLAQVYLTRPATPENLQKLGEYAGMAGQRDLKDPRPPYLIGRLAIARNDLPRALKALEFSLTRRPLPETVSLLATTYRRAGQAGPAAKYAKIYQTFTDLSSRRESLLAAYEREPRDVKRILALAELYLEASQRVAATQWVATARETNASHPDVERVEQRILTMKKNPPPVPMLPLP